MRANVIGSYKESVGISSTSEGGLAPTEDRRSVGRGSPTEDENRMPTDFSFCTCALTSYLAVADVGVGGSISCPLVYLWRLSHE